MDEKPLWRMVAGRKAGPYDPAKLRPLVKDGRISPLDRFSYDGEGWRPAGEFPELLRAPAVTSTPNLLDPLGSNPLDSDSLISESVSSDFTLIEAVNPGADFMPRTLPQAGSSLDEARLLKAMYLLIAFGGGMFVLLISYIIVASILGGSRPQQPAVPLAPTTPAVVMPLKPPSPSVFISQPTVALGAGAGEDAASPAAPIIKHASGASSAGVVPGLDSSQSRTPSLLVAEPVAGSGTELGSE